MRGDRARGVARPAQLRQVAPEVADARPHAVDARAPGPSQVGVEMGCVGARRLGGQPLDARDIGEEARYRVLEPPWPGRGAHARAAPPNRSGRAAR